MSAGRTETTKDTKENACRTTSKAKLERSESLVGAWTFLDGFLEVQLRKMINRILTKYIDCQPPTQKFTDWYTIRAEIEAVSDALHSTRVAIQPIYVLGESKEVKGTPAVRIVKGFSREIAAVLKEDMATEEWIETLGRLKSNAEVVDKAIKACNYKRI